MNYPALAFSASVVLFAGFVRGLSGFGFSMIMIISLSFVFPPVEIVPMILLWEVSASVWLLPRVWRQVDWGSISWLLLGVLIGTPIGVFLLRQVPAKPMQAAISVMVIILIILVWQGFRTSGNAGRVITGGVGVFSGILNGGATIGGIPVVLFYYSSKTETSRARASLIAFILATDLFGAIICATQGLMTSKNLSLTGMLLIPLVIGLTLGSKSFFKADPEVFRHRVMSLLVILSIASLIQTLYKVIRF